MVRGFWEKPGDLLGFSGVTEGWELSKRQKLKFGNCKNEQRHRELLSGKGITGCGVREEGD